jgi:hypothetical protein
MGAIAAKGLEQMIIRDEGYGYYSCINCYDQGKEDEEEQGRFSERRYNALHTVGLEPALARHDIARQLDIAHPAERRAALRAAHGDRAPPVDDRHS